MAGPGYGGFFLKGLAGGLQTGINLGIQIQEMQWQKAQRKKLEEKEKKIEEGMATFGSLIRQYGEDNIYSDEEVMQLNTAFMASVAEVQAAYKDAMDNIQTINKRKLEEDFQLLDLVVSSIDDLSPGDARGIFDTVKGWVQTDKAKNYFTAFEDIHRKRYEAREPDISKELDISAKLPEEYRYPYLKEEGIVGEITPTTKAPAITDYNAAWNHLMNWANVSPEAFGRKKTAFQRQFPNIDMTDITQEALRSGVKPEEYRATPLETQEKWKQKSLDANTWEDAQKIAKTYTDAGYDPAEMLVKQDWINAKLEELDSHVEMLKEITDENGRLMGSKSFKFLSGEREETQTGEQWYKDIYEAYMFYLDELRKMGIDVSKYRKIKSPGEVSKVGFLKGMFTGGGVERGYPSIYYTETVPTPTETEIPKLPSL